MHRIFKFEIYKTYETETPVTILLDENDLRGYVQFKSFGTVFENYTIQKVRILFEKFLFSAFLLFFSVRVEKVSSITG